MPIFPRNIFRISWRVSTLMRMVMRRNEFSSEHLEMSSALIFWIYRVLSSWAVAPRIMFRCVINLSAQPAQECPATQPTFRHAASSTLRLLVWHWVWVACDSPAARCEPQWDADAHMCSCLLSNSFYRLLNFKNLKNFLMNFISYTKLLKFIDNGILKVY